MFAIFFIINTAISFPQEIPDYRDVYVNDFANIFSSNQTYELKNLLKNIKENTNVDMTIFTTDIIIETDISDFSQKVFDKWKIGEVNANNGLLIVYVKNIDEIFVMPGYGLEGILTDSKIGRVLDNTFVKERSKNNSVIGIINASKEFNIILNENSEELKLLSKNYSIKNPDSNYDIIIFIVILIFLLFEFFLFLFKRIKEKTNSCPYCGEKSNLIKREFKERETFEGKKLFCVLTYRCKQCEDNYEIAKEINLNILFIYHHGGGSRYSGRIGGGRSGGAGAGR